MNWVVPFTAIASISAVLISAVITVISLRDSPHTAIRRDVGNLQGGCSVLHVPTQKQYKPPSNEFRQMDAVTIDVSACEHFIEDFHPPELQKAMNSRVNVTLRPSSTDHAVFLQVYCGGDFGFMAKLSKYLPIGRPATFLDAGANIGMATLLFSQLIMGNGQVLSVEANPETAQVLQANVASLPHVVMPVHAALVDTATAEEKSTLTFKGRGSEYWGFRVDHNGRKQEDTVTYEVETRTLAQIQDMASTKRLDFIKLDVEGEEKWLLNDPKSREVLCSAICIFMELHERMEQGCNAAFQQFMKATCDTAIDCLLTPEVNAQCGGPANLTSNGCAVVQNGCTGEQMEEVVRTGEYILVCQKQLGE